ncbi:MAG: tape measure protein [Agathobacter rectalis]
MANVSGGSVVWDLDVDNKKLSSGLSSAKSEVEKTGKEIDSSVGGMMSGVSEKMGSMSDSIVQSFKTGGLAATAFITTVGLLGNSMINVAADFEQNRIAFETLTGSAETGRKVLADLSDFAVKTPFELPGLQQNAKQLLAYGVEAKNLIPTLEMLGNMAAGVGMDKMPQLILAFGQVKAATKLTGMELRQFSEAGVPLLQALVDKANDTGGVLTKVGGVSKETGTKIKSLASSIANTEVEMKFFKETGGKTDKQLQAMQKTVDLNKYKLAQFGTVGQDVYTKVKVTAEQMKDAISDGKVTFEQVQEALKGMSGEGGKFFNLMDKQSKTFSGVMSNIRDQVTRSFAEIMGINIKAGGIIREGSLFAELKIGAEAALAAINKFTPILVDFTQKLIANKEAVAIIAGALGGAILLAVGAFITIFGAGIIVLVEFMAVGALIAAVVIKMKGYFDNFTKGIQDNFAMISGFLDKISGEFKAFAERTYKTLHFDTSKIGLVDFFSQLWGAIKPQLDNIVAQIQQGFTNAFKINFGDLGNVGDFFGRLMAFILPLGDLFLRVLTPAFDTFVTALGKSKPMFDLFLQQIGPILIDALTLLIEAIALVTFVFIGLFSGIVTGVSMAIPFIVQAFTGIAQFINGIMTIITGIFTLNWKMIWDGIKTTVQGIYNVITGTFLTIAGFIAGFIKGIISFFQQLYDMLIGHSIVPDLVNGIAEWFGKLPGMVRNAMSGLVNALAQPFKDAWGAIEPIIKMIKDGLDRINPFHRNSPSLVDNVKAGVAIIADEFASLAGINLPPIAYQMQQYADPMYSSSASKTGDIGSAAHTNNNNQQVNVYIEKVNDMQDVDMISRQIGFQLSVQ